MLTHLPSKYPRVKAIVYTNAVEDNVGWPIETSGSAQAAFRSGISSSAYATNQYATISGKIPAPGGSAPAAAPPPPPSSPASTASSASFTAVADTYTSRAAPRTVEGASHALRADIAGTDTTYMRFDLSSLAGKTITSAKLKVHTTSDSWSGSSAIFDVNVVASDQWTESMTLANAVAVSGTRLGTLSGPTHPNTAYSIGLDLSALKSAGSFVSLAIRSRTTDVMLIDSRESGAATAPVLDVTY
jgi:hypothetical protein